MLKKWFQQLRCRHDYEREPHATVGKLGEWPHGYIPQVVLQKGFGDAYDHWPKTCKKCGKQSDDKVK